MANPPNGPIQLAKGDLLFDDGAPSDAMYVVKSGCIAIVKRKGPNSEIELARIMPGQLFGEMAFFDNKPRSAGARAVQDSVVIALPFTQLHAQFKKFPEWLKAMVKTVNDNLRNTNKRLKELEKPTNEDAQKFPPHTVTKLAAILMLVASKYGEREEGKAAVEIPYGVLRRYTIQVFQEPTHKMEKLIEWMAELDMTEIEKLSEGRKKIIIKDEKMLTDFVEFYNDWLFKSEDKKTTIIRKELPVMKALMHFGKESDQSDPKAVKVQIDEIRKRSVAELDYLVDMGDYESLIEKGIVGDKMQEESGVSVTFNMQEVSRILPFWQIIFKIEDKDGYRPD